MPVHPDIEFQMLEHLRALREEVAALHQKLDAFAARHEESGDVGADDDGDDYDDDSD